jgi:antitoxin (DNA-binding transcriptional repressor) of toxin-antitoxin stability system
MIEVSKSRLKAKMLEYFRRVEESGEALIVTNHGIPALKVSRIKPKKTVDDLFADVRNNVKIDDTVMQPETDEWDV